MAPKKKEQQKMSLGTFLQDEKLGSWADEMEDMPVYSRTGYGSEKRTYSSATGTYGSSSAGGGGYSVREELPLPDKPPYTVHLGNLSFDATIGDVQDFFADCECTNVRIIEDKMEMKPKGFGYAEFGSREGLIKALALSGAQFQGRNIRVSVADPPKDRDRPDAREFGDWSRKGPLPDLPGRGSNDRRISEKGFGSGRSFGDAGSDAGPERRERRDPFLQDDGKIRDLGNWERRGPLSPLPQPERQNSSREGGRPRTNDGPRGDGFRDRKSSPAAWGEGRQGSQDGSRPPRREFQERSGVERAPTAAEQDNQWRAKMKPDAPAAKSPVPSRDGSEAPSSPAVATAPTSRPKLNLAKRTVSQAPDQSLSASDSGDVKASPFGAARPIDTAAKEKEIEEKRQAAVREKKEAEDKAKEEKRLAKEAVKSETTVNAEGESDKDIRTEAAEVSKAGDSLQRDGDSEKIETENMNGDVAEDKSVKPKEIVRDARPKSAESGAWRRPSGGPRPPRNEGTRISRGDGLPRGTRNDGPHRSNGSSPPTSAGTAAPVTPVDSETAALEEDGWSTVAKPKKRGGNQAARAVAS